MKVLCPACEKPLEMADELSGKVVECSFCKKRFTSPALVEQGQQPEAEHNPIARALREERARDEQSKRAAFRIGLAIALVFALWAFGFFGWVWSHCWWFLAAGLAAALAWTVKSWHANRERCTGEVHRNMALGAPVARDDSRGRSAVDWIRFAVETILKASIAAFFLFLFVEMLIGMFGVGAPPPRYAASQEPVSPAPADSATPAPIPTPAAPSPKPSYSPPPAASDYGNRSFQPSVEEQRRSEEERLKAERALREMQATEERKRKAEEEEKSREGIAYWLFYSGTLNTMGMRALRRENARLRRHLHSLRSPSIN